MKPVTKTLIILLIMSQCFTNLSCKVDDRSCELSKILYKAKEMSFLKSLIVLKDDKILVEEYINGGHPDQLNDIRSASKSILSSILGCAIKDGYIHSIDQKVIDFFPEYKSDKLDPKGYFIGGWGLSMTAKDMLKFGTLYLKNGIYGRNRLIPARWINTSTTEKTGMIGTYYSGWNKKYGYGYLWWIRRLGNEIDIPFAMGHGGQRIVIMPNVNAVIVTQAEPNPKPPISSYKRHRVIDSLLFEDFFCYLMNNP